MPGAALQGVRVLDFGQQLPVPFATLLLAQLGAEVIKVEPPTGDVARTIDPRMFEVVNAGKHSVVLDLKAAADRASLLELAATCDVLVEGFRPGTAERLGFGYGEIRAVREDVIYCSLSGYGAEGPYRDLPGHDVNYLGIAAGAPRGSGAIGIAFVDMGSGTTAALAIVAAVRQRDASGEGAHLDLAMLDVATFWAGVKVPPEEGSEPAYGVFAAADGELLTVAVLEDKFWRNLCECLGWADWVDSPELATHACRRLRGAQIDVRLRETLARRPRDAWLRELQAVDVPAAPVNRPSEVAADPQIRARGLVRRAPRKADDLASGWFPTSPLPAAVRSADTTPAPTLGASSSAGLADLDL